MTVFESFRSLYGLVVRAVFAHQSEGAPEERVRWVGMEGVPEALAVSRAALLALRAGPT